MLRCIALVALVACLLRTSAVAEEPPALLIVAADQHTKSLIRPLPTGARLVVLIHDENEAFEAVDSRALAVRFATHVVYDSRRETTLSAIYRERLQNHGAIPIDLRVASKKARPNQKPVSRPFASLIANLPKQPQR